MSIAEATSQQQMLRSREGHQEATTEEIDIDVRGLFLMLWRRKLHILSIMFIGLTLAAVAIFYIQPRYTARSLILIDAGESYTGIPQELAFLAGGANFDTSLILSEIEIIRSRTMARRVVEELNLMTDPEFNPRFKQTENNNFLNTEGSEFKGFSIDDSDLQSLPPEVIDEDIAKVVTNFLQRLNVRALQGSSAIQIEFTSVKPQKAAMIANAVADIYIEQRLEEKFKATKKLTDWLDLRLSDLRTQVRESEKAVQEYKEANNLVEGARSAVSAEQLSALNAQLVSAKAQLAEARARYDQIREILKKPSDVDDLSEVVNATIIERLKLDEIQLQREFSELSLRYGDKHPRIVAIKSELDKLRTTIRSEVQKIAKSIRNEVLFAEARVKALQQGLQEISGQRFDENAAMIRLRELMREADSTRLIYDTFLQTYKRKDQSEALEEPEARIISYAIVPQIPTYPNRLLLISLSAAVSLFIGLGVAVFMEKLDNTYRSANMLEKSMGYPCYALIPQVEDMPQVEVARYTLTKPSSTVAESVRTLRMVLNLRSREKDKKCKVVTITSSFPGEGKTTLSMWMGRLAAKSGEKVIVIDCDLRRPNIHRAAGKKNETTLVEYLTGKSELDQVIQKDDSSGVHMIYGRSVPNSALDLVSSEKMEKLVKSLAQVYDFVILDSPACLAVSDARVLATLSDQTLYAVAWDRTPREVVISGVKQFSDMNYRDMAFVLTNVDVQRHVRYGYGDTVYYYGRYKEYYSE